MSDTDSDNEGAKNGKTCKNKAKMKPKQNKEQNLTESSKQYRGLSPTSRRKVENEKFVKSSIINANGNETGAKMLDLAQRDVLCIPDEMMNLESLQFLYLEGNAITQLPDNFFKCFLNLQWLDLRNNFLNKFPSIYVGRHKCLKTLLLEGNELKTLPLELGNIPTLTGLNICRNPLEFPPSDIVQQGTKAILLFLREMLHSKSQGKLLERGPKMENLYVSNHGDETTDSDEEIFGRSSGMGYDENDQINSKDSQSSHSDQSDLIGPVPSSAALHMPTSYSEIKQQQNERLRQAGAMGTKESKRSSGKGSRHQQIITPVLDKVERRFLEEQQLARVRLDKLQQEYELQRRRDIEARNNWRDESRKLQAEKYREAYMYGGSLDQVDVAKQAPFGIDDKHMKVPSNEERIKNDVRDTHERLRQAMSPRSVMIEEALRKQQDQELKDRIIEHTQLMQERRRHAKSANPQQEMENAKRELEVAEQLQREVEMRRRELEYRMVSHTGER